MGRPLEFVCLRFFVAPARRAIPLTAVTPQITINNEYRTRSCGDTFDPEPHPKERSSKSNGAC